MDRKEHIRYWKNEIERAEEYDVYFEPSTVKGIVDVVEEQQMEIEQLKETLRICKLSDELVKEQSRRVKHLFPFENTAGYGQLCDRVLAHQKDYEELKKSFKYQTDSAVRGWEKVIRLEKALEEIAYKGFNAEHKRIVVKMQSIAREALDKTIMSGSSISNVSKPTLNNMEKENTRMGKKLFVATQTLKDFIGEEDFKMEAIKVCLHKKNAHTLERNTKGQWILDGKEIEQEKAIAELVEAVQDLGYWCQVAKDVLPTEQFEMVENSYSYHEETPTYKYICIECDAEYTSEDQNLRYCDSDECLNKDNRLNGPFLVDTPTI
ncbi:hypothetical protein [Peribacillus muralis]|uniref:hypothetical protein n=1 Tax=Peribacillus muralis TaxID=264697 RepID=UPI003D05F901